MTLTATPIYTALLTFVYLALSYRVVRYRFAQHITIGDNSDKIMQKRIRVHSNFMEYAPLGIILLLLCEVVGTPLWVVHALGLSLLLGRVCHAIGFGATPQIIPLRQAGMVLTFLMLAVSALGLLGHALI